jgi:hypothetical protein
VRCGPVQTDQEVASRCSGPPQERHRRGAVRRFAGIPSPCIPVCQPGCWPAPRAWTWLRGERRPRRRHFRPPRTVASSHRARVRVWARGTPRSGWPFECDVYHPVRADGVGNVAAGVGGGIVALDAAVAGVMTPSVPTPCCAMVTLSGTQRPTRSTSGSSGLRASSEHGPGRQWASANTPTCSGPVRGTKPSGDEV